VQESVSEGIRRLRKIALTALHVNENLAAFAPLVNASSFSVKEMARLRGATVDGQRSET